MEDDEFEYDLKKCGTDIDTNDSSILCKDDDYPLSDTSFSDNKSAVENMNQRGNRPELVEGAVNLILMIFLKTL